MVLKSHIRSANNGSIFHGSRNPTKVTLLHRENRPWNPQSLRCKCENPTTWLRTGIPWLERALIYLSSHQRRIRPKSERLRAVQFGTGALLEHPANVNSAHLNQLESRKISLRIWHAQNPFPITLRIFYKRHREISTSVSKNFQHLN